MATTVPLECVLPQIALDNTLGAAYLGNIAAAIFYGITNVQTYIFYERSHHDGRFLKGLVFLLWLLDGLHLALISHTLYFYSVTNFSNLAAISRVTWSIMAHVMVTGISDLIVRGVFTYRVWRVSEGKLWLMVAIIVPSLVVFAGSFAFPIRALRLGTYAEFSEISWILYMAFGAGVVADMMIAASLCIILARRRTGFRRTDSMVRVLMVYSINTGALTSFCALTVLITYATMPNNFVFIAFYFILPKLFLNSLLATLNAREKLRDHSTATGGVVSIPLSTAMTSPTNPKQSSRFSQGFSPGFSQESVDQRHLEIQIQTTTDRKRDSISQPSESWRRSYAR